MNPFGRPHSDLLDRLKSRSSIGECWLYLSPPSTHGGHCKICWKGKKWLIHRASWVLFNGDIPDGVNVLHRCVGHPNCWNPDHLYLGTQIENVRDIKDQGRWNDRRGEGCASHKLTNAQVVQLRGSLCGFSMPQVAEMFGITPGHLRKIRRGAHWSHI